MIGQWLVIITSQGIHLRNATSPQREGRFLDQLVDSSIYNIYNIYRPEVEPLQITKTRPIANLSAPLHTPPPTGPLRLAHDLSSN